MSNLASSFSFLLSVITVLFVVWKYFSNKEKKANSSQSLYDFIIPETTNDTLGRIFDTLELPRGRTTVNGLMGRSFTYPTLNEIYKHFENIIAANDEYYESIALHAENGDKKAFKAKVSSEISALEILSETNRQDLE